jgi:hypothetical protein
MLSLLLDWNMDIQCAEVAVGDKVLTSVVMPCGCTTGSDTDA